VRYACADERRLRAVKEAGVLNGIEYVEVSDTEAPAPALRQRTLFVRLLKPLATAGVTITGGERIPTVPVEWVAPATAVPAGEDPALVANLEDPATVLLVRTATRGDFSLYTLRLTGPPAGFDPRLTSVEFSFKVECPSPFDCGPACTCGRFAPAPTSAIDYLAKDFGSFRRLMLDRMSVVAPGWTERNPADVGVALVELLAYVADELSYRQDAVVTEAYLGTARLRASLRRHARLVDYRIGEGTNARVWARLFIGGEGVALEPGTQLLTRVAGVPRVVTPDGPEHRAALVGGAETFEVVEPAVLYKSHERLRFWTWGDDDCHLPRGATAATLEGEHPNLKAGDVLVLAEVRSPTTGQPADADPAKRVAVRLTHTYSASDPAGGLFSLPPSNASVDVTEIQWGEPLPFDLCVADAEAFGNIVLADHGRTVADDLPPVPESVLARAVGCPGPCEPRETKAVPVRYRPQLPRRPVTHARSRPGPVGQGPAAPLAADLAARTFSPALHDFLDTRGFRFTAATPIVRGGDGAWSVSDGVTVALLRTDSGTLFVARPESTPGEPRPAITLDDGAEPWAPQPDLLASDADAPEFVVEVEHDGTATLRFGDGVHGRRAEPGTAFHATYRVGNGVSGNIGADALAHVATLNGNIDGVDNLLPAAGGTEPEPADAIRRDAPQAFLVQQRAVTESDYARRAERTTGVQRAAAAFRWTGSWHTVFVTADRERGLAVDDTFEAGLRADLEPFRMAGYDLEVDGPRFVALDVGLFLCAEPEHFRANVRSAVLDVLTQLFDPDNFTFGQPVYLSRIVAAAKAVEGVQSVTATRFERQRDPASSAVEDGVLPMGRLEIARLDNDPNFPERGVLALEVGGGK
jgi:Baseplate J-like protein